MVSLLGRIFICLYWVALICFNIRNFAAMEAQRRNVWIYLLIAVNAIVIVFTAIAIFI